MRTALVLFALVIMGCGGSAPAPTTPSKPNAAIVNGCNGGDYADHTADADAQGTHIKWDESIAKSNDRCVKIRVGQTIAYAGNFTTHPLEASGGDANSPFANINDHINNPGTPEEFVPIQFKGTGVFGYKCSKHPEMTGAILVVP